MRFQWMTTKWFESIVHIEAEGGTCTILLIYMLDGWSTICHLCYFESIQSYIELPYSSIVERGDVDHLSNFIDNNVVRLMTMLGLGTYSGVKLPKESKLRMPLWFSNDLAYD